jgi:hypothetical protein
MRKGIYLQTLLILFFSAGLIDQPFAGANGWCSEAMSSHSNASKI